MQETRKLKPTRRTRLDIIGDILRVCNVETGATKTKIVYGSNINFKLLKEYLAFAFDKGFLEEVNEKFFRTTEQGNGYLDALRELNMTMLTGPIATPTVKY